MIYIVIYLIYLICPTCPMCERNDLIYLIYPFDISERNYRTKQGNLSDNSNFSIHEY